MSRVYMRSAPCLLFLLFSRSGLRRPISLLNCNLMNRLGKLLISFKKNMLTFLEAKIKHEAQE